MSEMRYAIIGLFMCIVPNHPLYGPHDYYNCNRICGNIADAFGVKTECRPIDDESYCPGPPRYYPSPTPGTK